MYQVFQPAVMNWVPLMKSVLGCPFVSKKNIHWCYKLIVLCHFFVFKADIMRECTGKIFRFICMNHQNLAVSLTPANVLNNYPSQEWKIIFLKFSFSTESNMQRCWITHRIDNEFLYLFSIAKFKAVVRFKMEVTISRWVHFIT